MVQTPEMWYCLSMEIPTQSFAFSAQDQPLVAANALVEEAMRYATTTAGARAENLQHAIACFQEALRAFTQADYPLQWALIQNNLGSAFRAQQAGDRAENLRHAAACCEAALRVFSEADHPQQWAATQNSLGATYAE